VRAVYRNIKCKGRGDKITIVPIGDTHLGCRNVDMKKLQGFVRWINETPNVYWLGMGDYVDSINYSDKRFDPRSTDDIGEIDDISAVQIKNFVELFGPIAGKCLGLLGGNHEEKVRLRYHRDILSDICEKLHVDNLTYSCMMRVYFKRCMDSVRAASKNIVIFAHHGHGGGRAVSGKLNMVLSKAKSYEADVYLVGHCHLKANLDGERIYMSHGKGEGHIYSKKQLFATTGSFMKSLGDGYSPYSEVAGYEPIPTGLIKITVEPFRSENWRENGKHKMRESAPHIHMSV
jgi:predicted phosphodiesterase